MKAFVLLTLALSSLISNLAFSASQSIVATDCPHVLATRAPQSELQRSRERLVTLPDGRELTLKAFADSRIQRGTTSDDPWLNLVSEVVLSPDQRYLAAAAGSEIYLWDAQTGENLFTFAQEELDNVFPDSGGTWITFRQPSIQFAPDSRHLVLSAEDPELRDFPNRHVIVLRIHRQDITRIRTNVIHIMNAERYDPNYLRQSIRAGFPN